MLVLAVDTSAKVSSVSLVKDKQLLAITTLNTGNTHSETLLTSVNGLMGFANVSASDIDLFAVSAGPGSFTGIRIGVALVKGLAFGHKKCAGVSTLEALARNLEGQSGIICPVMDARRSQVYNALFKYENGRLVRLCEDRLITLEELKNELLTYNEDVRLVGDGYGISEKYLADLRIINTPEIYRHQNAYSVAMCALDMYEKGEYCDDETLLPIYLRQPQAERERLERLNNAK